MSFDADNLPGLLDGLPEPLIVTTVEGEIAFTNAALRELAGYEEGELTGQHVSLLMPQPERRRLDVIQWLARWADDPDPEQLRFLNLELATRDGKSLLISVRVSRYVEGDNHWFLIVFRDVTSEHETLSQLRHAQLVTNRILAIGEDAVISIDGDHRISFWNRRAAELFGYTEEEALGQSLELVLPERFAASHEGFIDQFANSTAPSRLMGQRGEIVGRHKFGREMPLEAAITKTVVGGETILSAQVRDITARKAAEAALRDSEARFRAGFENAFEAMALLDPDGHVIEINQAARALLPDFTENSLFWELNWWHASEEQGLAEFQANLKSTVAEVQQGERVRNQAQLGDRKIDVSLIPVKGDAGELRYIIVEGRDLTVL